MQDEIDKTAVGVADLHSDMSQVKDRLTVHEARFGSGRERMQSICQELESLKPKAPDWLKISLAVLTVIGILMGGQLWITDRFNTRPTKLQVDKVITPIRMGQKETSAEIKDIEKSQSAQQESIKNIEKTQIRQEEKIDRILDRIPARISNRYP